MEDKAVKRNMGYLFAGLFGLFVGCLALAQTVVG